ncbi:serine hydrolase domain-containing protein [Wenzhouxiangella marina]|uniref:6-aminohexanoate hydrolase n=1 Tax=Wenzhouxiangella marina TaxID=1579979 RepID=A0A0K0XSV1_9GAMM|nr:serine hydrolase [Wenzhouxiangella marina]AKS40696.1 6-aminohexanoate hydrolase [Wenzhouxiangella marina]MBB6088466.1 CubicO group peptidase (beta-lactamase class C family) [Wenzhouxiangella marina]
MVFLAKPLVIVGLLWALPMAGAVASVDRIVEAAEELDRLHALIVLQDGVVVLEHVQGGPGLDRPANLKSVSKTVMSTLVGMAIERGLIEGVDQSLAELLGERFPAAATPGAEGITVDHALSLRAGLASTSGRNYGRWVQSEDWVAHVLTRPMSDRPGGRMIYSTGPTHLLSAVLAEVSGRSTEALARDWLGQLGIRLGYWPSDPQGIAFGGNDMHISPRDLARLGEWYRLGGELDGRRGLNRDWIDASWQPRGTSPWSGDDYGYGWFVTELAGQTAYYGRGYGGQALFVLPDAAMTVVITSDPNPPSPGGRYFGRLKRLVEVAVRTQAGSASQSLGLR